jgi:TatD DNase family protein
MVVVLPFDAHNHVHMGPSDPQLALMNGGLSGMAVMATQLSDFPKVLQLCQDLQSPPSCTMIPCLGIHPWWAHTLPPEDWKIVDDHDDDNQQERPQPKWIRDLETFLLQDPSIPVGEIGIDKFHFDGTTGELTCPMDIQIQVFQQQLELATKHQRPCSIHCVHAAGPLMDSLNAVQKRRAAAQQTNILPPALYFHAFGGKPALVDQLEAICCGRSKKRKNNPSRIYFGVAPVINFRSPHVSKLVQKIGLERLVLETDHEDAALVPESMRLGVEFLAQVLDVSETELVQRCNHNAMELYRGHLEQHDDG